jgi:transcriptional regulator with XRE-family HTH domain
VPRNQRLADAVRQMGWSAADLAEKVGADAKTTERWISTGRTPHPRLREASATALGVPAAILWPNATAPMEGLNELVGLYPTRAEVAPATVRSLLAGAHDEIDVLAYGGLWLWDAVPKFAETLAAKLAAGCRVRVCLGDPESEAVRTRGEEEGIGDGMAARCRLAIAYSMPVAKKDPGAVRLASKTLYASIFRFDDELLVNVHLWGNPANASPVLSLRKQSEDGVAANVIGSFERVWATAVPLAGAP